MEMLMLRLQNRTSQNSQKSFGSYIHLLLSTGAGHSKLI